MSLVPNVMHSGLVVEAILTTGRRPLGAGNESRHRDHQGGIHPPPLVALRGGGANPLGRRNTAAPEWLRHGPLSARKSLRRGAATSMARSMGDVLLESYRACGASAGSC